MDKINQRKNLPGQLFFFSDPTAWCPYSGSEEGWARQDSMGHQLPQGAGGMVLVRQDRTFAMLILGHACIYCTMLDHQPHPWSDPQDTLYYKLIFYH